MTSNNSSLDERLRFIKHKGHVIYSIDFTHCAAKELLLLLDLIRADIARHAPGSVLTFVDVTGAQIDKQVATRIKEVLVLDRPYVKRSAWVGTESSAARILRALQELLATRIAHVQDARRSDGLAGAGLAQPKRP